MRERVTFALREHFRPEFLNRIDEMVFFHRLEGEHIRQIAEIQLGNVRQLLAKRNISIEMTDAAMDLLIEEGYDPAYGARPLKRVIQQRVIDPLALQIIQNEVRDGDLLLVDAKDDELTFTVTESAVEDRVAAD
jgi:ATP-dependent Clp protease ATP-binding subunit ClpB